MAEKKIIDWESIEKDYRAGLKSLRDIASQSGVSEGAVRKRAKRDGWVRNLAAKIQAKAEQMVRTEAVRNKVRANGGCVPESKIIEVNAQIQAGILFGHREDIRRHRELLAKLLQEVESETDNRELFAELGDLLIWKSGGDGEVQTRDDQSRMTKLQTAFDRVMSTPGRIGSLAKLAETLERIVRLERQALGIKDDAPPPPLKPVDLSVLSADELTQLIELRQKIGQSA